MKSRNVWGDRLQAPFKAVGDHIGCELPGGRALFFTRRGGVSGEPFEELNVGLDTNDYMPAVEENRRARRRADRHPAERWLEVKQVHGADVRLVTEPPEPGAEQAEADGVATTLEGYAAVVVTADCLPVALIAPEARRDDPRRLARPRRRRAQEGRRDAARGSAPTRHPRGDRAQHRRLLLRGQHVGAPRVHALPAAASRA